MLTTLLFYGVHMVHSWTIHGLQGRMCSRSIVVAWTTCNSIYRIAIQQRLLVEFSCDHYINSLLRALLPCVIIGLCVQWLPQHWPSKKLSKKYFRPYKIVAQPSILLFTLHLPEFMCSVYPVFHVSMLEPAMSNTFSERIQLVSTSVIIDRESEYEISWIVDSKIDHQQTCKLLYKVIWLVSRSLTVDFILFFLFHFYFTFLFFLF